MRRLQGFRIGNAGRGSAGIQGQIAAQGAPEGRLYQLSGVPAPRAPFGGKRLQPTLAGPRPARPEVL
jgi:hypothetical protein